MRRCRDDFFGCAHGAGVSGCGGGHANVASICIDEPDLPLSASLVPIFLITALEILNSTLVWFCPKYAQLLLGKPVTIIRNGEILQDELAQLRITASDLAEALRGKDIFSPKDVYWGVIEPNGSITAAPMRAAYAAAAHR